MLQTSPFILFDGNCKEAMSFYQEWGYSPYNCFGPNVEFEPGKFRIQHLDDKIPMLYALTARKK